MSKWSSYCKACKILAGKAARVQGILQHVVHDCIGFRGVKRHVAGWFMLNWALSDKGHFMQGVTCLILHVLILPENRSNFLFIFPLRWYHEFFSDSLATRFFRVQADHHFSTSKSEEGCSFFFDVQLVNLIQRMHAKDDITLEVQDITWRRQAIVRSEHIWLKLFRTGFPDRLKDQVKALGVALCIISLQGHHNFPCYYTPKISQSQPKSCVRPKTRLWCFWVYLV